MGDYTMVLRPHMYLWGLFFEDYLKSLKQTFLS